MGFLLDERCEGLYPPTCIVCKQYWWTRNELLGSSTFAVGCTPQHWIILDAFTLADWRKLMLSAGDCSDFEEAEDD